MGWKFSLILVLFFYSRMTIQAMKFQTIMKELVRPSLNVTWDSDGVERNYTVKMMRIDNGIFPHIKKTFKKTTNNDHILMEDLNLNTKYNVTLIVSTDEEGAKEKESMIYQSPMSPMANVDSAGNTARVLLMYNEMASFYQIIVRKLKDNENDTTLNKKETPSNIDQNMLKTHEQNSMQYITVNISQSDVGKSDLIVKIGDEKIYDNGVLNAKLHPNTRYSFFQRTFFNQTFHDSLGWSKPVKNTEKYIKEPVADDNGYEVKYPILIYPGAIFYQVIVRKLSENENSSILNYKSPTHKITQDSLKLYVDDKIQYIAINTTMPPQNSYIVIGNGKNNNGVLNAKLESSTRYTFFQRTFFLTSINSSAWTPDVTTKPSKAKNADDSLNETEIAIITVGVAIGIIVVVFFLVVCCHWKYSRNYAPKPKKLKNADPEQRQLTGPNDTSIIDIVYKTMMMSDLVLDPGIPVTENDFYDHVAQMKFHNFKGFYEEFTRMDVLFSPTDIFCKPENNPRNRYLNVPCFDHSIVSINKSKLEAENTYIHASFVPGFSTDRDYILTQSPLPETIRDFWTMVWEYDINTIVMIGHRTEKGNIICAPYFPESVDVPVTALHGQVKLEKEHRTADYVIRDLKLVGEHGVNTKKVKHCQFLSWPAVRITPACPTVFLQFMKAVNKTMTRSSRDKPIVIHGTTGTGRPGIYACVDSQIRRVQKKGDISVYSAVQEIREHRFDGVKTLDEYIFIHDTILEYILKKNIKDIDVEHLPHYIENSSKNSPGELFSMEYNFLAATVVSAAQRMDVANLPVNKTKNRYDTIKPFDNNRVKITKQLNEEGSDYINASFIDTYSSKQSFIATQAPLVGTVGDFWRMIYENQSWVIVMLGQEIEKGQLKADRFWPEEGYVMALGHLTVKFISKQSDILKDVLIRQVELIHEKNGEKKLIQIYQYLSWPSHEGISSESIYSLVQLVHQSQLWKEKLKANSITVVSSSGVGRPGVFIALRSLQEESEEEGRINIFQTVQKLRQQRSSMIQTREEYILIYTSAMEITKHVRRKSIVAESIANVSTIGMDILPNSLNGSVNTSIMERLNSVSQTSQF